MTSERLDAKVDIAEQLAWRDQTIDELKARLAIAERVHSDDQARIATLIIVPKASVVTVRF